MYGVLLGDLVGILLPYLVPQVSNAPVSFLGSSPLGALCLLGVSLWGALWGNPCESVESVNYSLTMTINAKILSWAGIPKK